MAVPRSELPIDRVLPSLVEAVVGNSCVVLKAPAGAGKTTRVPPALFATQAQWTSNANSSGQRGEIVMLEPRRIAARTAARRMAFEMEEPVGRTVGYRVRFEENVSRETRILVVTEGILLRRLQDDPFLETVDAVIFDEFHERRLDSDVALAMVRRVQQTVRPELRIIVMSATLDPTPIARFLDGCPIVESEGRLHPIKIRYAGREDRMPLPDLAADGVQQIFAQTDGHILTFLPGVGEIHRTRTLLEPFAQRHDLEVLPLFGEMSAEEQDKVLAPSHRRKVILATNVAETSVTIEGVTAVVDTGVARQMQFDSDVGLDRLMLCPISKASADQRAGRAGRTQPGVCLRLWDEASHRHRPDYEAAELHRVDLSASVLRLFAWGETDPEAFPWYESPPQASLHHAIRLLKLLGAIDDSGITNIGRELARFPVSPRIARLLFECHRLGVGQRGALMAAMLSERDCFLRASGDHSSRGGRPATTTVRHHSRSDVLDRLHAIEEYLKTGNDRSPVGEIHRSAVRTVTQVAKQLNETLSDLTRRNQAAPSPKLSGQDSDDALLRAMVVGFPDRVAKRREATGDRGLMVGGRGVRLGPRSAVQNAPLFLCIDIDGSGTDALVRQASEVERDWLPENALRSGEELFFHPTQKQVVARKRVSFDDLILDETPTTISDPLAAAEILFEAAKGQMDAVTPKDDDDFLSFVSRARALKVWMPELPVPDIDDNMLRKVLRELCHGRRSFSELRSAPWLATLQSQMDYATVQTIEREAPERITVPTGSRIRLTYEEGRPPVLAVRIQEIFGMKQTPRIAGGRVPILLHLLAPNMRPQQVTDDLASFWANTYETVRKELKRRYPKHSWPEDPLSAPPVKKG